MEFLKIFFLQINYVFFANKYMSETNIYTIFVELTLQKGVFCGVNPKKSCLLPSFSE